MLAIGQEAPEFTLPNQDGVDVRLRDLRDRKIVIFSFPKAASAPMIAWRALLPPDGAGAD